MMQLTDIQVSLYSLMILRFFGFVIFLETAVSKKSLKEAILSIGWLLYAAGPLAALVSYSRTSDINHPLFGFFIALGTLLLVFSLVQYYFEPRLKAFYLMLAIVIILEIALFLFFPEWTSLNSVFLQLLILLVAGVIVLVQKNWIVQNGSLASYVWIGLFLVLSLFSIATHLVFPEIQLSSRFLLTFVCNTTLIVAFNHFEKAQSYQSIVRQEKKIRSSLKEKEILLNEIHHRVYNNMAIMSSLLNLQVMQTTPSLARESLKKANNRIQAMALVHKLLYKTKDLGKVDLAAYIEKLAATIEQTENRKIKLEITAEEICLPPDILVPCGLILNELINNAMSHAYGPEEECKVLISANREDSDYFSLIVRDRGRGLPDSKLLDSSEGLGLPIIESLVSQLGASGKIETEEGFAMSFRLPLSLNPDL